MDCICLCFCRTAALKPTESFSTEMGIMIDWGAAEIVQEAAVRNSFASCELRKNC